MDNEIVMMLAAAVFAFLSYMLGQGVYMALRWKNYIACVWYAIESCALGAIAVCCIVAMFLGKDACSGIMILLFKVAAMFLMTGAMLSLAFAIKGFDDVCKNEAELVDRRIERSKKSIGINSLKRKEKHEQNKQRQD